MSDSKRGPNEQQPQEFLRKKYEELRRIQAEGRLDSVSHLADKFEGLEDMQEKTIIVPPLHNPYRNIEELTNGIAALRDAFLDAVPEAYEDTRFPEMIGSPLSVVHYVTEWLRERSSENEQEA